MIAAKSLVFTTTTDTDVADHSSRQMMCCSFPWMYNIDIGAAVMLFCVCSVKNLATLTKMTRARSVSRSSSHCIHSSCFTCADHSSYKCSTTAPTRRPIIGGCSCSVLLRRCISGLDCLSDIRRFLSFIASTLLVWSKEGHLGCKKSCTSNIATWRFFFRSTVEDRDLA